MVRNENGLSKLKESLKSLYGTHSVSKRWRDHMNEIIKELENELKEEGKIISKAFGNIPQENRERVAKADTLDDLPGLWALDKIEERVDSIPVKKVEMPVAHCYPGYRGMKEFIPKKIVMAIISDIRSDIE